MFNISDQLPKMITGHVLEKEMLILPDYDDSVRNLDSASRLVHLTELEELFVPSPMACEIYTKIYLAMVHSLNKKETKDAICQRNHNFRAILGQKQGGILGGSDSFTIMGPSGIGKSSALFQSINISTENKLLKMTSPHSLIIPCLIIQCPHDCSVKGMLLEILKKVDIILESNYYDRAIRTRASIDMLVGSVSQMAINHIGLLVIDEIQNVCKHRNGVNLISCLTQLINNSGISLCMVGLPETERFFAEEMHLARRSVGLSYKTLPFDRYFHEFCEMVWRYQYTSKTSVFTEGVAEWLYEHSSGIVAIVVSLIKEAQEIAILSGEEELSIRTMDVAYRQRMGTVQNYIQPSVRNKSQTGMKQKIPSAQMMTKGICSKKRSLKSSRKCNRVIAKDFDGDLDSFILDHRKEDDFLRLLSKVIKIEEVQVL